MLVDNVLKNEARFPGVGSFKGLFDFADRLRACCVWHLFRYGELSLSFVMPEKLLRDGILTCDGLQGFIKKHKEKRIEKKAFRL